MWIKKIKNNVYLEKFEVEFLRELLNEKLEYVHDLGVCQEIDEHYHRYY